MLAVQLLTLFTFFSALVAALNPIEVQEQEFIDSKTGKRFVLLGVDYQPGGQAAYGEKHQRVEALPTSKENADTSTHVLGILAPLILSRL